MGLHSSERRRGWPFRWVNQGWLRSVRRCLNNFKLRASEVRTVKNCASEVGPAKLTFRRSAPRRPAPGNRHL